jgi:hypothetical protein
MSGRIAAYPLANLRAHSGALPLNELNNNAGQPDALQYQIQTQ